MWHCSILCQRVAHKFSYMYNNLIIQNIALNMQSQMADHTVPVTLENYISFERTNLIYK